MHSFDAVFWPRNTWITQFAIAKLVKLIHRYGTLEKYDIAATQKTIGQP
jgi:hypothetical protein